MTTLFISHCIYCHCLFVLDALWPHLNALEGSFCLALFLDIKIYLCGYRGFGKKFNERIAAAIIGEWNGQELTELAPRPGTVPNKEIGPLYVESLFFWFCNKAILRVLYLLF